MPCKIFFLTRIILLEPASEQRNKVSTTPSTSRRYMHLLSWSLHCTGGHTVSDSTLDGTVSPGHKVVCIPPTTAVGKQLALLDLGIVCEPLHCTITWSAFHGTGAQIHGLPLCKTTARTRSNGSFFKSPNCGCSNYKPEPKTMNPSKDDPTSYKIALLVTNIFVAFYLHMGSCPHIFCFRLTLE